MRENNSTVEQTARPTPNKFNNAVYNVFYTRVRIPNNKRCFKEGKENTGEVGTRPIQKLS